MRSAELTCISPTGICHFEGRRRFPATKVGGEVVELGAGVNRFTLGQAVGVPWLGGCCGMCTYRLSGQENLCDHPTFTGYDVDGGYAESVRARADFCIALPAGIDGPAAAPLLSA